MIELNKIRNRKVNIIDHEQYQKSAVILPLVKYQDQDCVLFEIRSQNLNSQPGEICFPGGGVEPEDKTKEETAIRETCEELGLERSDVDILGPLDILVTPFQFMIVPFVAHINDYKKITPNKNEVEEVFYVPVDFFLNTSPETTFNQVTILPSPDFPLHLLPNGKTYNWGTGRYPVHFYQFEGHTIWGITARIIHNFVEILKKS